ncbi:hypothetical protein TWF281_011677 [Arthrobotrys megalospora]
MYTFHHLHDQYGPYLRVSPTTILVADLDSVKKIHSPHDIFKKGSWYGGALKSENLLTIKDPQKYKHHRRAFGTAFSNSNLGLLEPMVRRKTEFCFKRVAKRLEDGEVVDIKPWFYYLAADIIGELCFGKDFGALDNETENPLVRDCINLAIVAGTKGKIPFSKYLNWILSFIPHPTIQWFCECEDRLLDHGAKALKGIRREIRDCRDKKPRPSLFVALLDHIDNPSAKYKLNMIELQQESTIIIVAGTDTVTVTGTYLTWVLLRNPEIRQKLIDELETVGWIQGDSGDDITDELLQGLPYLKCLLQEVLRLYAPVQIGLPRVVPNNGRLLGPYFIPEGIECMTQPYTLHRDPKLFDEPFAFKPERWLNATKEMESAIMSFGAGSRVCPGQHLAMMELRLMAAMMLKYCGDAKLADSCTDESMEIVEKFLNYPKGNKCELQRD